MNEVLIPAEMVLYVWPSTSISGIAGTSLGLLFGMFVAVGLHFANSRCRSMRKLSQTVSLPILAAIPRFDGPTQARESTLGARRSAHDLVAAA